MGMIANYQFISDESLKKLVSEEELSDFTGAAQENEDCASTGIRRIYLKSATGFRFSG